MSGDVSELLRTRQVNAANGWLVVSLLAAVVVGSTVGGRPLWALFAATLCGLALLPPLVYRSIESMLPWEILLLAALPVVGRLFATVPVTGNLANYLSVAAIGLIIAIEPPASGRWSVGSPTRPWGLPLFLTRHCPNTPSRKP